MPRVPIDRLKPGWYVGAHVYSANGPVLIAAGARLGPSYIRRLRRLGLHALEVCFSRFRELRGGELIAPELRAWGIVALRQAVEALRKRGQLDVAPVVPLARAIVTAVLRRQDVLVGLTDIRIPEAYLYAHSVNVCVLAVLTAARLGFSRRLLDDLALGAMLHDTGKALVDPGLLEKPGRLTADELAQVRRHSELGYEAARACSAVSRASALAILQHHERLDGSGYPRGLRGGQIGIPSRVVAVADLYEAVSSDRPYRRALAPRDCVKLLSDLGQGELWADAVRALASSVAVYPQGSTVRLRSGELAVVSGANPETRERPEVVVFATSRGAMLAEPYLIDLAAEPKYEVAEIVTLEPAANLESWLEALAERGEAPARIGRRARERTAGRSPMSALPGRVIPLLGRGPGRSRGAS